MQMVEQPLPSAPFGPHVFMMNNYAPISIATWLKDYVGSCQATGKEIADGPPPLPVFGPLEIERPSAKPVVQPPSKGVLRKSSYNPNAHAA